MDDNVDKLASLPTLSSTGYPTLLPQTDQLDITTIINIKNKKTTPN